MQPLTGLRGIVPPLVTPMIERDVLDVGGLERLIEHVLPGGVAGVFVLGTTGEAPSLSYRMRREVIDRACKIVAGRVPVLVGVTDTSFVETVALAKHAADAGAAAVVVAPPFYFPATQPEMLDYLQKLSPQLPIPFFLYNMPGLTKISYELDTVRQALELPNVIGLKDSSQGMIYFNRVRALTGSRENFRLLVGPEELLAESAMMGGDGGVCGGANMFPKLYVNLYESARAGDRARALALHRRVLEISGALYSANRQTVAMIKGLKCALSCLGICGDFMADPFTRHTSAERERVQKLMDGLKNEVLH